ncbi:MAG: hypothetical protein ACM3NI_07970 [Bacteroidota bacterium]
MKTLSFADYLGIASIFLFVVPVTLWTVVNLAMWAYGVAIFPPVAS